MADDEPWAETLPHYHKIEMVTSSRYRSCCNSKTCSQKSTQISAYIIGKSTSHTRPLPTDHSLNRGLDIELQSNIKCKRVKGDILPDTSPLTAINDKLVITASFHLSKKNPSEFTAAKWNDHIKTIHQTSTDPAVTVKKKKKRTKISA